MASVQVSKSLIANLLFGFSNHPVRLVRVIDASDDDHFVSIEVDGDDVPDCDKVAVIVSQEQNRAGDVLRRMRFEKVE